jgi:hypothetical protein
MRSAKSKFAKAGRAFQLEVMRLENRLVPGEVFSAAMFWACGPILSPALMADEVSRGAQPETSAETPMLSLDAYARVSSERDLASLSFCQSDDSVFESSASSVVTPATSAAHDETPIITTSASDQAFDTGTPNFDLGNALNPLTPAQPTGSTGGMTADGSAGAAAAAPAMTASGANSAASVIVTPSPSAQGGQIFNVNAAMPQASAAAPAANAVESQPAQPGDNAPLLVGHHVAAPMSHGIKPMASPATTIGGPYSPSQISAAYGFNKISNQGSGQTIYIVDAYNDPNISKDLATFDTQWGLPAPSFTVHKMSNHIRNSVSWGLEESLDVEWAHAMAPKANITLVEATSASNTALYAAVDWATNNGAHVVSMSWGGGDASGESSSDSHFNHTGVTYIAASGDTGAQVIYPSASPYVLSAGGTSLTLNSDNSYANETAWSSGGGGASVGESEPTYQKNFGISLSGKGTPDVSYNADPNNGFYVYDSYINPAGWYEVGGTSAAAPQWASIVALVNQSRSTPLSSNNLTSRTEYNAAVGSLYGSNYHDITTGSNGHSAGPGYDLATGIGSPQVNNLVPWLINNN